MICGDHQGAGEIMHGITQIFFFSGWKRKETNMIDVGELGGPWVDVPVAVHLMN
jgi:hypothetical protein